MRRILSLPYTFVLMNWAVLAGLFYFVTGRKDIWAKSTHRHLFRRERPPAAFGGSPPLQGGE